MLPMPPMSPMPLPSSAAVPSSPSGPAFELFRALPGQARLWLLALDAAPEAAVRVRLEQGLAELLGHWRHKGQAYQAVGALLEPQLLAVAEPTLAGQPSGCAIDGMLRRLHRLLAELGLSPVDSERCILVRRGSGLEAIPKAELQARLDAGALDADTPLLDLSLYNLADLLAGRLESPLARTWVGRRYGLGAQA